MKFWSENTERTFFLESLKSFLTPEKLFYSIENKFYAYSPKSKSTKGLVLQSRNSLIGQYTEKWCRVFLEPIAESIGLYCINSVVCPEVRLTHSTDADIAFCSTKDRYQSPNNIKIIFEVKMSIVNNYIYHSEINNVLFCGDFTTHKGNPSILRSDSMLKAIGKSINIRVSGSESAHIPIIILGNSPISKSYIQKVDLLKESGVIQKFISLYPEPTGKLFLRSTPQKGFETFFSYQDLHNYIKKIVLEEITFFSYQDLHNYIKKIVLEEITFFSSMISKKRLGEIIRISSWKGTDIDIAERFLKLLKG